MANWFQMLLGLGEAEEARKPEHMGYALCVGLNAVNPDCYEGWEGQLNACENDANAMSHLLQSKGYRVTTLLTKQATRSAVLLKLLDFATLAKPGDTVVFTNSSHGGQVPDYDNTEADGMDETICMFDGQIIDDELEQVWSRFAAGVRVVFVSDSCHSGTVARQAFSEHDRMLNCTDGSKAMPHATQIAVVAAHGPTLRDRKEAANKLRIDIVASVLALGACQDSQTAMDGAVNGAFTGALLQTLRRYPTERYGRIVTYVRRELPPSQTPSYTYAGPHCPLLESAAAFSL